MSSAGFAERRVAEIDRVETETQCERAARDVPPVRQLAVANSPAGPHHGLGIQLIGDADAGAEGVLVGLGEGAVAAALAEALIDESAGQSSRRRVRRVEIDLAAAEMMLVPLPAVVPAQAEVDGQFGRDLPVVLAVEAPGLFPPLDRLRRQRPWRC